MIRKFISKELRVIQSKYGLHHLQKCPGMCFNAYDDLFSIRKQEDETLQTLMNRVDTSIRRIQDLRPADFDLAKLDDELASMAMIC